MTSWSLILLDPRGGRRELTLESCPLTCCGGRARGWGGAGDRSGISQGYPAISDPYLDCLACTHLHVTEQGQQCERLLPAACFGIPPGWQAPPTPEVGFSPLSVSRWE